MSNVKSKKTIGSTDLNVSTLGFGGASIGNLFKAVSDEEVSNTMQAAIQSGVNFFDTAPRYGLGLSERRIGDTLREVKKSDYILSTKVGRILTPDISANCSQLRYDFDTPMPFDAHYDYTYDGIMRSWQDSMQRLGLAQIDILLVHDIGEFTHKEQDAYYYQQFMTSGYKALNELREQGMIKAVGLGVNETAICERVMDLGQFDCFLLASRYTLLEQEPLDTFLPKCQQHGASIILGGPYNSGILATGVNGSAIPLYDYVPAPKQIIERVSQIEAVCAEYSVPLPAAALQFPLAHDSVSTVIPGIDSCSRMVKTVELFNHPIPRDFWLRLQSLSLIREDAPLPLEG